jgi:hypothetical protein
VMLPYLPAVSVVTVRLQYVYTQNSRLMCFVYLLFYCYYCNK